MVSGKERLRGLKLAPAAQADCTSVRGISGFANIAHPSPLVTFGQLGCCVGWEHINVLGRYAFSLPEAVSRGELRPLRSASDVFEESPDNSRIPRARGRKGWPRHHIVSGRRLVTL